MTFETARTLHAELARLERATTTIPVFKARQEARKAEILVILAEAEIEPEPVREDPRTVRILRATAGGDRLDGNRHW